MTIPKPSYGEQAIALVGVSAVAREVSRLPIQQRQILKASDEAVLIWDLIVSCSAALTDDTDPRPWGDRLDEILSRFFAGEIGEEQIEAAAKHFETFTKDQVPEWTKAAKRDGARLYLERLLGAAAYNRLKVALRQDCAILVVALRRAARNLMPYAVAMDDLFSALPAVQARSLPALTGAPNALLTLAIHLDQALEKLVEFSSGAVLLNSRESESTPLELADLAMLADKFREVVSGRSRAAVKELSAALGRKIQGARDALEHSADPVAQAANSLIELIDRLLRAAFTDDEVMEWLQANYPSAKGLTYIDQKGHSPKIRPTKKAQVLCFVHAGLPVAEPSPLHEMAATAIVTVRAQLQKLKHADLGTEEEAVEVARHLNAVEGFLQLAVGVTWALAPDERVNELRTRLEPTRVPSDRS
ncbi:hypothetical protein [Micromonospora sp. KC213]|uniref:hypothetical protein n=1 Tax=Micromonospora sp. KC213 TaxID=2530378 RepID=UPI001042F372|nr:hypothetical protein [Micromonospora sp. KC213]TDC37088.1 hypothetical protein E1166_20920 [Micromonospora sp. KC213]